MAAALLAFVAATYSAAQGMKDYGNRLEGTNIRANALEDLALVALHRDFEFFSQNANLSVRFFLPQLAGIPKESVFIEAAELQDSFHYFMKSKPSSLWRDGDWNSFRPWPTKDVIDGYGIQADNLGVLVGYQAKNKLPVYLPADVYQNQRKLGKRAYTFHVLTGQDLQSLDIFVSNAAGTDVDLQKPDLKCPKDLNANCKKFAAESTLAFELDMSPLPEGEYHLRLVGHVRGNAKPTSLEVALYHRPVRSDDH